MLKVDVFPAIPNLYALTDMLANTYSRHGKYVLEEMDMAEQLLVSVRLWLRPS